MKVSNDFAAATMPVDGRTNESIDGNEFAALLAGFAALPGLTQPMSPVALSAPAAATNGGPQAALAMTTPGPTIDVTTLLAQAFATQPGVTEPAAATPPVAVEVLSFSLGDVRPAGGAGAPSLDPTGTSATAPPMALLSQVTGAPTIAPAPATIATPTTDAAPAPIATPTTSAAPATSATPTATIATPATDAAPAPATDAAPAPATTPTKVAGADDRGTLTGDDHAGPVESGAAKPGLAPVATSKVATHEPTAETAGVSPVPTASINPANATSETREPTGPKMIVPPNRIDTVAIAAARASADADRPIRLTVRLDPPNLGELRVEITARGGQVTVRLEPTANAAAPALQQQRAAVAAALERSGFELTGFDVADPEQQQRSFNQKRGTGRTTRAFEEAPVDEAPTDNTLRI